MCICVENFNGLNDKSIDYGFISENQMYNLENFKCGGIYKMLREMMKPKYKGSTLEINLSEWGYPNYIAECAYHFDKKENKYLLSMWLNRTDLEDRMRLSSKKVDTQYIPGTRETIVENICRIVHHCATVTDKKNGNKYFDHFVDRYEYELACFERGNELFEQERLAKLNVNKE